MSVAKKLKVGTHPILFFVSGKKTAGKSTVSEELMKQIKERYDVIYSRMSFATPLKEFATESGGMVGKDRKMLVAFGKGFRKLDEDIFARYFMKHITFKGRIVNDDLRFPNEMNYIRLDDNDFEPLFIRLLIDPDTQEERIKKTYPNTYEVEMETLNDETEIAFDGCEKDFDLVISEEMNRTTSAKAIASFILDYFFENHGESDSV